MSTEYTRSRTTERILRLKENRAAASRSGREDIPVRDEAYSDAQKMYPREPLQVQSACGFAMTLQRRKIIIQEDDLLAGYIFKYTYNTGFPMRVSADFDPAVRASLKMDVRREIREARELGLAENGPGPDVPEAWLDGFGDAAEIWLIKHWHSGHTLAGYEKLLRSGFAGLLSEAAAKAGSSSSDDNRAFIIVLEACIDYIGRYEAEVRKEICRLSEMRSDRELKREGAGVIPEEAGGRSPERISERIRELERMEEALSAVKSGPPETFYQALQLLALAHEMMYCENVPSAISIGRFDQYMYPFYSADIRAGRLTDREASELIDDFWLRCSTQQKAYQNITLGGCGSDGRSAFNELTYMCLDTAVRLRVDQPSVNFRWTDDITDEQWDAVIRLIRTGMGFPAIFYDPCCMQAQLDAGISASDVWNYGFIGCVELAIPGMENAFTELARINIPKFLDIFLHNGYDVMSGKHLPVVRGECGTYEELERSFLREYERFVRRTVRCLEVMQRLYAERYPLPYLSVLTDDCIERGKDINAGGARYCSAGFNLCGIATAADSLAAVRKMVYEEQLVTLDELTEILSRDYEGHEDILSYASGRCPKYGNDEGRPEETAARLAGLTSDILSEYRTYTGGPYRLGLYTVEDHAIMGQYTGATPDGRRRGKSLSNSTGASQGRDVHGPTALINSVTRFPMVRAQNGMVMDLKFLPSVLEGDTGSRSLRSLITTYFRKGGMEVQISAVSQEVLIDAQNRPEEHADLIVRVSGFSAYFTSLRKVTQDEIIERTGNGTC